jgi:hypothetical protein
LTLSQSYAAHRELRYFIYKLDSNPVEVDPEILNEAYNYQNRLFHQMLSRLQTETMETLHKIDRPDVALVGPLDLISELSEIYPLRSVTYNVDIGIPDLSNSCVVSGIRLVSIEALKEAVASGKIKEIIIVSFKDIGEIVQFLRERIGAAACKIQIFNRQSGMDSLFGNFDGKRQLIKGLVLQAI